MKNNARIQRKIVKTQIADLGADSLTSRGKKYIRKEIEKLRSKKAVKKLRWQLEHQEFNFKHQQTYWEWLEQHGEQDNDEALREYAEANPDILMGDVDIDIDENMVI